MNKFISKYRKEMHLSQKNMAEKLGMSLSGYKKIEYSINKISLEKFIKICTILSLNPSITIMEVIKDHE